MQRIHHLNIARHLRREISVSRFASRFVWLLAASWVCLAAGSAFAHDVPNLARPLKDKWQASQGSDEKIREALRARLNGWPETALVNGAVLPDDDRAFLRRVAQDTWRGLYALSDHENGLPLDFVRFGDGTVDVDQSYMGDYTSPTNIGMQMAAITAAMDLGFIDQAEAQRQAGQILSTLEKLQTYKGFFYNYYDTTTLERTTGFISFVDSGWLSAGLIVTRQAFPKLAARCTKLLKQADYSLFLDRTMLHMHHGYFVDHGHILNVHYGVLFAESRIASLIAIGKGDVPAEHWFRLYRTLPEDYAWQAQPPIGRRHKEFDGMSTEGGRYRWEDLEYVPSWGGSMFEALMPRLMLDEGRYAPDSLGRNGVVHATLQRRYATEILRYPVWGMSPSSVPGVRDYGEFGAQPLGVRGYGGGVVTPHAAALAILVTPREAIANLRELARRYSVYGDFGFYDAVKPDTGQVSSLYMYLDQSMLFLALANYLTDGAVQKRYGADPIIQNVLPLIGKENFFD